MKSKSGDKIWTPLGNLNYLNHYPNTPFLPKCNQNISETFINKWQSLFEIKNRVAPLGSSEITIVLVKGIFGDLMPGNFNSTYKLLKSLGLDVIFAKPHKASATIEKNAASFKNSIERQITSKEKKLLFLTHSKGGLDTLWAMLKFPQLKERTVGVALVQCTRNASEILEGIFTKKHPNYSQKDNIKDLITNKIITYSGYKSGCLDLTSPKINTTIDLIDKQRFEFPIISVATWSIFPTSRLESFHKRLKLIRPGCAHDGLFYIENQLWPNFEQIILGNIDHSQPTLGGNGFDDAHFYLSLLHLFFIDRQSS